VKKLFALEIFGIKLCN